MSDLELVRLLIVIVPPIELSSCTLWDIRSEILHLKTSIVGTNADWIDKYRNFIVGLKTWNYKDV